VVTIFAAVNMITTRFYRYLIYGLYSWRIENKDDTPAATIIIIMSFVHIIQLGILYMLCDTLLYLFFSLVLFVIGLIVNLRH
jgi:hypothetical protein